MKPYIGITGFKTVDEVVAAGNAFGAHPVDGYVPMFGIASSAKRLADKRTGGEQTPAVQDIPALLTHVPNGSLPMLHYHTTNKDTLIAEVEDLFLIGDVYAHGLCRAMQLNMDWPSPRSLEKVLGCFPDMAIVLQLPKRAMGGLTAETIATKAHDYEGLVQYVLIDPSGGKGIDFDEHATMDLLHALDAALPSVTLGVAGGLSGDNVGQRVSTIRQTYTKSFCIDAQGKLRCSNNLAIDPAKAQHYIQTATHALS